MPWETPDTLAPRPDDVIGRFVLEERLGRGAVGTVWRARHMDAETMAALKLVSPKWVRVPGVLDGFEHEVAAAAALIHPNVALLLDHGRIERDGLQVPWLATELVEGGSIQPARTWPWAEIRDALLDLLDALAYAHARGVVHRDVKPGNVLIADGRVKLTDFGLAHRVGQRLGGDSLIGTPSYMAPEQIRADTASLGPWTDLYGTACLAWTLVTGHPPFQGTGRLEVMAGHLDHAPPRLEPRTSVPKTLEDWLRWLLEKDPKQRPLLAADAALALRGMSGPRQAWVSRPASAPSAWRRTDPPVPTHLSRASTAAFRFRHVQLVGREGERDRMWETLMRVVQRRRPEVLSLEGPVGCGKSRLAQWMRERACELGIALPLKLDPTDEAAAVDDAAPVALRAWRAILEREPRSLEDAVVELCAWRPVILQVEDAEQTPATLAQVARLVARQDLPLLVVLTLQPEDLAEGSAAARALADLPRRRIAVEPLPTNRLRELAGDLLFVRGPVVEAIVERAGGSPRFVIELLRDWVERDVLGWSRAGLEPGAGARVELPASIRQVWEERLDRVLRDLPADDAIAVELGAMLGAHLDPVEFTAACDAAGITCSPDLLPALVRAGLARVEDGPARRWTFAHGMVRDALQGRTRASGRWTALHLACAAALARIPERARSASLHGRIGHHLVRAERPRDAVDPLLASLTHSDPRSEHRLRDLLRALEQAETPEDDARWGRAWNAAADIAARVGGELDSADWTELTVAAALAHGWMPEFVVALSKQAMRLARVGHRDAASETARRAIRLAPALEPSAQLDVHVTVARVAASTGHHEQAAPALERLAIRCAALGRRRDAGVLGLELVQLLRARGETPAALRWIEQSRRWLEETGSATEVALADELVGDLARERGDLSAAGRAYELASRRRRPGAGPGAARVTLGRALVHLAAEEWDQARELAEEALLGLRPELQPALVGIARLIVAHDEVARGRVVEAEELTSEVEAAVADATLTDGDLANAAASLALQCAVAGAYELQARAMALAELQYAAVGRTDLSATPLDRGRRSPDGSPRRGA